jgi:hypothetical protein
MIVTVDTSNPAKKSPGITACGIPGSDIFPPAQPIGLSASPGVSSTTLRWSPNQEPDLSGYNVYRSATVGGTYEKVNTESITYPNYTATGLVNDTIYWFKVTAIDLAGNESRLSTPVSSVPSLDAASRTMGRSVTKGWNILAIPSIPGGAQTSLDSQSGGIMTGKKLYSIGQNGEYLETPLDQQFSALPGMAGWYFVDNDSDALLIQGQLNADADIEIQLNTGWNLVGNPFINPLNWNDQSITFTSDGAAYVPLSEAISSAIVQFSVIWVENGGGDGSYRNLVANGTDIVPAGQGFWIKVSRPVKIHMAK